MKKALRETNTAHWL